MFNHGNVKLDDPTVTDTSDLGLVASIKPAWWLTQSPPPHQHMYTPSVSLTSWLPSILRIKVDHGYNRKWTLSRKVPKWPDRVSGKVTILIAFLKSLSRFQMLRNWKVLIRQHGGGRGWQVRVPLRQLFIGKILAGHLEQLLPGLVPANPSSGLRPLLASGQRRVLCC